MDEHMDKATLLERIQNGYRNIDTLLSSLSEEQLTTPGVTIAVIDGVTEEWSVKDHLAHLAAWHRRLTNLLQAIIDNVEQPDPTPNMTVDEINAAFYHDNKDLPLHQVQDWFSSTYLDIVAALQKMSNEQINAPISWLENRPLLFWVTGNTYEHYQEHYQMIQQWLSRL